MKLFQWLNLVIQTERFIYRWHRWFGSFALAGSVYVLRFLAAPHNREVALAMLNVRQKWVVVGVQWLLDAFAIALTIGVSCVAVLSLFLIFRPSALRRIESHLNQWYSARGLVQGLELERYPAGRFFLRHRIMIGCIVFFLILYALSSSWPDSCIAVVNEFFGAAQLP